MAQTELLLAALLRKSAWFRGLSEADFHTVAGLLRERRLRPGEVLFHAGEAGDFMVLVGSGRLEAHTEGQGEPGPLKEFRAGDVIGEMACLDPSPRVATVTATADSLVFELSHATLRQLEEQAPAAVAALVGGIIRQLTARLRQTNERIQHILRTSRRVDISAIMPRVRMDRPAPPPPTPYRGPLDLEPLRQGRTLSDRDLEILVSVAPPMLYPDGALLCVEGRPASSCFLLVRGAVEVLKNMGGIHRVLATLSPGAFVGQMALVDHTPRSASVRAVGEAVVLTLERADFDKLLQARSPLALRFQQEIAIAGVRQLRLATARLAALTSLSSPRRARAEVHEELSRLQTSLGEWTIVPPGQK
ncbi:MAG: cyclic nucleotide-binding domain-containing protein [Myxococcales bacterium]|nr:cyclic nucleotide-binding domain-containing protein [Myxococcota bacterium]MDW8280286.1 cyclic nucleotide-binding domain-containing protein [Myxococcales bacterium]